MSKKVLIYRQSQAAGSDPWSKRNITKTEETDISDVLQFLEDNGGHNIESELYRGIEGYVVDERLADTIIREERRSEETKKVLRDNWLKELNNVRALEFKVVKAKKKLKKRKKAKK